MTGGGVAEPLTAGRRRARRRAAAPGRLRLAVCVLLLVVSAMAMATSLGLLVLRRELRDRDNGENRLCPGCRSPAILDGRSLLDEQGQRLLFATPEDAARYAAAYAEAKIKASVR